MMDATFWDERYAGRQDDPFDAEPNPHMERVASQLRPGTALDVGCGEGSDAVWLASQGWQVTAVDLSQVALDRGKAHEPTGRVKWLQGDILGWEPPAAAFDLVASHFLHFAPADRELMVRRLAAAVKPGGTLLVVSHHPSDLQTNVGRWDMPAFYFTASELAGHLGPGWQLEIEDASPRQVRDRDGNPATIHDTVLLARRV